MGDRGVLFNVSWRAEMLRDHPRNRDHFQASRGLIGLTSLCARPHTTCKGLQAFKGVACSGMQPQLNRRTVRTACCIAGGTQISYTLRATVEHCADDTLNRELSRQNKARNSRSKAKSSAMFTLNTHETAI